MDVFGGSEAPLIVLLLATHHCSILVAAISETEVVHLTVFLECMITIFFNVIQGFGVWIFGRNFLQECWLLCSLR